MKRKKSWGLQYSAFRYRLQLRHQNTDTEDYDGYMTEEEFLSGSYHHLYSQFTQLQDTYIGAAVGYEIQQYYGRFMIHYGADVRLGRSINSHESAHYYGESYPEPFVERKIAKIASISESRSTSIGLAPLFGMRYFIHPMLSVTAETQLSIGYRQTNNKLDRKQHGYYYGGSYTLGNNKSTTTFVNYTPVSLIGVTFHFEK